MFTASQVLSFKVITSFAPAIDTCGATLGTVYYDAPYTIGTKSFRNWWGESRGFTGYSSIREGIIYSMNIVAVRVLMETVTPQLGVEYAKIWGSPLLPRMTWAQPLHWAVLQKVFQTWS